ncbi:ATP-dependent nuclease [Nocardia xishanensis]|uniref:ATP-dependent nuclease n=1 Tax=Nocardia xishanensis TaxID=238964 RepID=UPI0009FCD5ED|nr:ATP-binding protein [Nocardia xishanensis]
MLARLQLTNFKGFEKFSLRFGGDISILVGPNNAGKTTAIGALRLCAQLLSHAKLRKPEMVAKDETRSRSVNAYRISSADSEFSAENVPYEFRTLESRLELHFKNKAALYVVWPEAEDIVPYFYLEHIAGAQPPNIAVARKCYSSIGVIQTLAPIESREAVLSAKHVTKNLGTRLASRHFRNQLHQLRSTDPSGFDDFKAFLLTNSPEITAIELCEARVPRNEIDLFFNESNSKVEKELYWAGDGLQIWFQLLFHIWRLREVETLILDEPDVYLHPDLQRRLVSISESRKSQVIMATHAPEVLAETNPDSVVVIDRTKRSSKKLTKGVEMTELSQSLGSGFNLRLVKALRSKVALFVEGNDMKILSNIARKVGAHRFYREQGLSVVPMGGSSRRGMAAAFGWLNSSFLDSSVDVWVILDRDYLSDDEVSSIVDEFKAEDVSAHIWSRNELESFLVHPELISRMTGLDVDKVNEILDKASEELKEASFAEIQARELKIRSKKGDSPKTIYMETRDQFDRDWQRDVEWRRSTVPGKDLISAVSRLSSASGGKSISARGLSANIRSDEVPKEMTEIILSIERRLD